MTRSANASLEIRPYQDADFPAVVAFVSMIQEFEREQGSTNRRLGGKIAVPYAHHICGKVAMDGGILFMACMTGAPVGFISAWPSLDDDPLIEPETRAHGYVSDIFVLPNWRRSGVGQKLLAHTEQHFRTQGIARLRIGAVPANAPASSFYQGFGFKPYEVVFEKSIPMPTHSIVDGKIVKGAT
jgi:ribosomal protein S18 acetylase RimI-like enzyme